MKVYNANYANYEGIKDAREKGWEPMPNGIYKNQIRIYNDRDEKVIEIVYHNELHYHFNQMPLFK